MGHSLVQCFCVAGDRKQMKLEMFNKNKQRLSVKKETGEGES